MKIKFLLLVVFVQFSAILANEANMKDYAPNIFIDCENCDFDYIRSEIEFVNYVIDHQDADIYILITSEKRGGGGEKYTLNFSGRKNYVDQKSVHYFTTQQTDTDDNVRVKMARALKLGLVPYVADTPIANNMKISFSNPKKPIVPSDKWNNWVFRTALSGDLRGQKSAKRQVMNANFVAERITEQWIIRLHSGLHYQEDKYKIGSHTVVGISRSRQLQSMIVKSLGLHWSLGWGLEAGSSTFSNLLGSFLTYPVLEYNIFPYSESTLREFRIYYGAGFGYNDYNKTTIYNKSTEWLTGQRMGVEVDTKQEWGRIDVRVEGMSYFHDMSKNHLNISGNLSLRLVRGLSLAVQGGFSMIHDQFALPKGEASSQEILMQIRELESQYNYWFALGFEYTFGSIYNNVVNSRLGNGG